MRVNALVVDLALLGPQRVGLPRAAHRGDARARAWSSAPAARPSPSACAGCGWAPTTGSPSPATPRRCSRAWRPSCAAASRPPGATDDGPVVAGELEIRADQFQAFAGGRSVDLTRREFEVLQLLAHAEGKVLQREEIYQQVWGYAMAHGDRSVDVFIRKVRQKLEGASPAWKYIHTHFGVGYRFDPEPNVDLEAGDAPEPATAHVEPALDEPKAAQLS